MKGYKDKYPLWTWMDTIALFALGALVWVGLLVLPNAAH